MALDYHHSMSKMGENKPIPIDLCADKLLNFLITNKYLIETLIKHIVEILLEDILFYVVGQIRQVV